MAYNPHRDFDADAIRTDKVTCYVTITDRIGSEWEVPCIYKGEHGGRKEHFTVHVDEIIAERHGINTEFVAHKEELTSK